MRAIRYAPIRPLGESRIGRKSSSTTRGGETILVGHIQGMGPQEKGPYVKPKVAWEAEEKSKEGKHPFHYKTKRNLFSSCMLYKKINLQHLTF